MNPIVSVVIPCFNSGEFLPDAIDSVKVYPDKNVYEIIVVNDGSNDEETLLLLRDLELQGYKIIHQDNGGPAAARNTGVKNAKGEYILFLDSDNKIRPDYIDKAIRVLKENAEVGVVHSNLDFFGNVLTKERVFVSGEFDLFKLLTESNYIDMCSVVRKKVWEDVNGLDEERILIGHEDWEFWIRVGASGWKFHFINEILFDYRLRGNSLITKARRQENAKNMRQYIYKKHLPLYEKYMDRLLHEYKVLTSLNTVHENDQKRPFRSFIKYCNNKYFGFKKSRKS